MPVRNSSLDPFSAAATDDDAIAAASGIIRGYCGWHIWPEITETLVLDGPGTELLLLPTHALSSVDALVETSWGRDATPVALNVVSDIAWSEAGMVRHTDRRRWTSRPRGISITITHGLAFIPPEVAQLAAALAGRAKGNPSRLRRMQVGQRSEDYAAAGLLEDEMRALDPYRRVV